MKEKILNEKKYFLLYFLVILMFGGIFFINYATDSYDLFLNFNDYANLIIFQSGRFVLALIYKIWYLSGLNSVIFYYFSYIFSIILLIFSVSIYAKILNEYLKNEKLSSIMSFLIICNVYILDYFLFAEKICFMLAIFLNVLGAYFFKKAIDKNKKINYFICVFFELIGVFSYQGISPLFIVLTLPIVIKKSKNVKTYFKLIFMIIFITVFVFFVNFLTMKILGSGRISVNFNIFNLIYNYYCCLLNSLFHNCDLSPNYTFLFIIIYLGIILMFHYFRVKNKFIKYLNLFISFFLISTFSMVSIMLGSGWITPRIIYPFGSIIGIFILYILFEQQLLKSKKIYAVIIICISLVLINQYYINSKVFISKYQNDISDKLIINIIQDNIDRYEEKTNIKIKYLNFYDDKNLKFNRYDAFYFRDDTVISAFNKSWSNVNAFNYILKKNYKSGKVSTEKEIFCSKMDWDTFSNEQLIFDGDELHICLF